jgi:hypothetical protein
LSPEKAALPLHFPTDRLALAATVHTLGAVPAEELRMARIRSTKHLERLYLSRALWDPSHPDLHPVHPPEPMRFVNDDLPVFPE